MTDNKRITTTAFATFIATVVGGIILLSLTSYGDGKKNMEDKLSKKLDKIEYNLKCVSIDSKIIETKKEMITTISTNKNEMTNYVDKQNEILRNETNSKLNLIITNQRETNRLLKLNK